MVLSRIELAWPHRASVATSQVSLQTGDANRMQHWRLGGHTPSLVSSSPVRRSFSAPLALSRSTFFLRSFGLVVLVLRCRLRSRVVLVSLLGTASPPPPQP